MSIKNWIKKLYLWYEIIDSPYPNRAAIRIKRGKYKGIELLYGVVKPSEVAGQLIIDYECEVLKNPTIEQLKTDKDFQDLTASILHHIITENPKVTNKS